MKLHHIAIWTFRLEELKDFYVRFLGGTSNEKYINPKKGRGALKIGVFNTQHELTFVVACEKPGIESGTCTTDVQIACRARREASFDFHEMALRYKDAGNRQILGKKRWAIFYHCGGIPQC